MLTERDLRELIDFRPGHPVLSVYLSADPAAGTSEAHKLRLRQMLKDLPGNPASDIEAVERFVHYEYDWSGRGLAAFSCQAKGFFRAYPLFVPLRSRARQMERPYVKPLADLLDRYGGFGVALVDRQGARLFHFHMGELREQEGTLGTSVRKTKQGGGSTATGMRGGAAGQTRHAEEVADRNLREASRFAAKFFKDARVRRILVGGTEETVAQFLGLLPKTWQSLVVGSFPMDMNAGQAEVLERSMGLVARRDREREGQLVQGLITAAAKGREGVIGLDETLAAVHDGRTQTLIISDGYRAPGYRCAGCAYLTTQSLERCPFCGQAFDEIEDAVESVVRRVLLDGGDVEVVHGDPALDKAGRIGALLRY
jgi:peptide chain release factor subunit 1